MSSTGMSRWQFSIRVTLLTVAGLAACFSVALIQLRRVQKENFVETSVRPITDKHVSSVGYLDGRILWLRVNDISPHHPQQIRPVDCANPYGRPNQWRVIWAMYCVQRSRTEDVREQTFKRSRFGLATFGRHRRWIASSEQTQAARMACGSMTASRQNLGLSHLHRLDSLQTIVLELNATDVELVRELQEALGDCRVVGRLQFREYHFVIFELTFIDHHPPDASLHARQNVIIQQNHIGLASVLAIVRLKTVKRTDYHATIHHDCYDCVFGVGVMPTRNGGRCPLWRQVWWHSIARMAGGRINEGWLPNPRRRTGDACSTWTTYSRHANADGFVALQYIGDCNGFRRGHTTWSVHRAGRICRTLPDRCRQPRVRRREKEPERSSCVLAGKRRIHWRKRRRRGSAAVCV